MLNIEHITKHFGSKTILNNVSLQVNKGEIAVLLGASGVGKSTLLRLLNNLETLDQGNVFLDNKKLDLSTVNKTHTIGFVFQNFNLFEHLTVIQNITLALENALGKKPAEAYATAQELLTRYGLKDKVHSYVSELSGGQKQRLALARTLALKPQVICLDEPTSALDPLLTSYVATIIQELAKQGYIVLVATHDTSLLERLKCTIYLMQEGRIIEKATAEQLAQDPARYPLIKRFIAGDPTSPKAL